MDMRGYLWLKRVVGAVLLCGVLVWGGGGCAAAGFVASAVQGPKKVEAKYKPTTRPTVVVVDSYRVKDGTTETIEFREALASFVTDELRRNAVVPVIDNYKVFDLRMSDPKSFRALSVDGIGKKLGAEQVVYVDLVRARTTEPMGGQAVQGEVSAVVKLVDVPTGKTLWPTESSEGYFVSSDVPFTQKDENTNTPAVREGLARAVALQIGRLFYAYEVPQ